VRCGNSNATKEALGVFFVAKILMDKTLVDEFGPLINNTLRFSWDFHLSRSIKGESLSQPTYKVTTQGFERCFFVLGKPFWYQHGSAENRDTHNNIGRFHGEKGVPNHQIVGELP